MAEINPILQAYDNHGYAAENVSYSIGGDFIMGTKITALTAINSIANGLKELGNFFGADNEIKSNYDYIAEFDKDLANYYDEHATAFSAAGEVVGSIIPGTMAVKVMRVAKTGKYLGSVGKYLNTPALKREEAIKKAKELIDLEGSVANTTRFKWEAIRNGVYDQALEGAAFELGAYAATGLGSTLNDESKSWTEKIVTIGEHVLGYGALTGGLVGGGIMGLTAGAKIAAHSRSVFEKIERPLRVKALPEGQIAAGTRAAYYTIQKSALEKALAALEKEGKDAPYFELRRALLRENAQRYDELAKQEINKAISEVDKPVAEKVREFASKAQDPQEVINALAGVRKIRSITEYKDVSKALQQDVDKLIRKKGITVFDTWSDMESIIDDKIVNKVKAEGADYIILNNGDIILTPSWVAGGRSKKTLYQVIAHSRLIRKGVQPEEGVVREAEAFLSRVGISAAKGDSYEVLSKVYRYAVENPRQFVREGGKLVEWFRKNADLAGKAYSKEARLFLDIQTGKLLDDVVPHIGDFKGVKIRRGIVEYIGQDGIKVVVRKNKNLRKIKKAWESQAQFAMAKQEMKKYKGEVQVSKGDIVKLEAVITAKLNGQKVHTIKYGTEKYNAEKDLEKVIEILKEEKSALAYEFAQQGMGVQEIARRLNVSEGIFKATDVGEDELNKWIRMIDEEYEKPRHAVVEYEGDSMVSPERVVALQQFNSELERAFERLKTTAAQVEGVDFVDKLVPIEDASYLVTDTTGASLIRNASATGRYNSTSQVASYVGMQALEQIGKKHKEIDDFMAAIDNKLIGASDEVKAHWIAMREWVANQEGPTFLIEHNGDVYVVNKGVKKTYDKYLESQDGEVLATLEEALSNKAESFKFKYDEVKDWALAYKEFHIAKVTKPKKLQNEAIGKPVNWNEDAFYLPTPPIKFYAHVITGEKDLFGKNKVGIIRGVDEQDLQDKIQMLDRWIKREGMDWRIVTKSDVESFKKAEYEYAIDQAITDRWVDSTLQKKGFSSSAIPNPDIVQQLEDIRGYLRQQASVITRRSVELYYGKLMSELEELARRQEKITSSSVNKGIFKRQKQDNVFRSIKNTMLGIRGNIGFMPMEAANDFIETWGSRVINLVDDRLTAKRVSQQDWEVFNKELKDAGLHPIYTSAQDLVLAARKDLDNPKVTRLVSRINGALAALLLRLDYIDPMINAFSFAIHAAPELEHLKKLMGEDEYLKTIGIEVPAKEVFTELSPAKVIAAATRRYFTPIGKARIKKYEDWGLVKPAVKLYRDAYEEAILTGRESIEELVRKKSKVEEYIQKGLDTLAKPSDWTTEFLQYLAVDTIWDMGLKAGMKEADIANMALTFRNRVLASHMPGHKPTLFQGPIGTAISLFQNYQFNLLSNLVRYVENGEKKTVAIMAAMQSSIFGAQSIPGFQLLNNLVAEYNMPDQADLVTVTNAMLGRNFAEYALYGTGSAVLGASLFTRGDLNPRSPFILPTTLKEVPVIRAFANLVNQTVKFGKNVVEGGDPVKAGVDFLAHSGLNRPLAGMVDLVRGYTTDNHDAQQVLIEDRFNFVNLWRIAGAKPLDEAIMLDRLYKTAKYRARLVEEQKELGQALRTHFLGSSDEELTDALSDEEFSRFMKKYVNLGHRQTDFYRWYSEQLEKATVNKFDRYMDLYKNSPVKVNIDYLQ